MTFTYRDLRQVLKFQSGYLDPGTEIELGSSKIHVSHDTINLINRSLIRVHALSELLQHEFRMDGQEDKTKPRSLLQFHLKIV